MILKPDDFEIGQFITVLNNNNILYQTMKRDPIETVITTKQDKAWVGTILYIKEINLPFIGIRYCGSYYKDVFRAILDTRDFDFVKLSDEFVKNYVFDVEAFKQDKKETEEEECP